MRLVRIGIPESDARLLKHGFSRPTEYLGRVARWTGQSCSMILPMPPNASGLPLTLSVACAGEQVAHFFLAGSELGTLTLTEPGWVEKTFRVGSIPEGAATAELRIECEVFHATGGVAACLSLADVTVGEGAAEEARPVFERGRVSWPSLYFGDLHAHVDERKENALDEAYKAAAVSLDFAAITGSAERMSADDWAAAQEKADKFTSPGSFVAFPAYEWSSEWYGDRCVCFERPGGRLHDSIHRETASPRGLVEALSEGGARCFTIPYHPADRKHPTRWVELPEKFQPVVEMYSAFGAFEASGGRLQPPGGAVPGAFLRDAWARGMKHGVVAGSGVPGLAPGARGLTAVYAEALTREAVFRSLRTRMCYATTGAKIRVEFSINGHRMGSEVRLSRYEAFAFYPAEVRVKAEGVTELDGVDVLENGVVVHTQGLSDAHGDVDPHSGPAGSIARDISFTWLRERDPNPVVDRYFYVRVRQRDGHVAWTSPIWVLVDFRETPSK